MSEINMLRPCPICESLGSRKTIYSQRFHEGQLGVGYDVVVCTQCGGGFADKIPSQAILDRYYANQSKYTYPSANGQESPFDFQRFHKTFAHLQASLTSKDARILDVGCATGGLLSVLQAHGFKELVGADPSPVCVEVARRLYNIEVRPATIDQVTGWNEKFDMVLMLGVLEHIREVRTALQHALTLLKNDSYLYIAVPDVEGFPSEHNAPFQQFSMEHINFFSEKSLRNLLGSVGLTVVRCWRENVQWRENVTEAILACLIKRNASEGRFEFDPTTELALRKYAETGLLADVALKIKISELVLRGRPILVWGTGALARRLLTSTDLSKAQIVGFIDSNRKSSGDTLLGRQVYLPEEIRRRTETILICSVAFQQEIVTAIRDRLGMRNELITLSAE